MKQRKNAPDQESKQEQKHRAPSTQALALLAAIIAPENSRESPSEATKSAARLWHAASVAAEDYAALLAKGADSLASYLESNDPTLAVWHAKNRPREVLQIGREGDSPLLDYINSNLPDSLRLKSLRMLRHLIEKHSIDGAVDKDSVEEFIGLRKHFETIERNERRRRSRAGGNKNRPGQA